MGDNKDIYKLRRSRSEPEKLKPARHLGEQFEEPIKLTGKDRYILPSEGVDDEDGVPFTKLGKWYFPNSSKWTYELWIKIKKVVGKE